MYKWNANNQDTSHSTYKLVWFLIQAQAYRTPRWLPHMHLLDGRILLSYYCGIKDDRINIEKGSWPNLDYRLNTINWHPGKPLFNSINKLNKFHLYQHHGVYQIRKHNNHQTHMTCKFHINMDSHCQRIILHYLKS